MKKVIVIMLGVFVFMVSGCSQSINVSGDPDKVETLEEILDRSAYITVVKVNGIDHTIQWAEGDEETSQINIPMTVFSVSPTHSIKNEINEEFYVGLYGGTDHKGRFVEYWGDTIIIGGEYNLLDDGAYYVMALRVHEGKDYLYTTIGTVHKLEGFNPDVGLDEQNLYVTNRLKEFGYTVDQ